MKALVFISVAMIASVTWPGLVAAQSGGYDPVLGAYSDYRAAQTRNDAAAAEVAAARALTASEVRDGGGRLSAVLAMNLAIAMMDRNETAQAIAPARRAYELARASAKGVDELAARLVLGEAELSTTPKGDERFLAAALRDADQRPDLNAFAYAAALTLEMAAVETKNWENTELAALAALRHLDGEVGDKILAKVRALTLQGLALVSRGDDRDADPVLRQALDLAAPLAPETADFDSVSPAEQAFADATAIRGGEHNRPPTPVDYKAVRRPTLARTFPDCKRTIQGIPDFPQLRGLRSGVHTVVTKIAIDPQGRIVRAKVLSIFPPGDNGEALPVFSDSNVRIIDGNHNAEPCEMASNDVLILTAAKH